MLPAGAAKKVTMYVGEDEQYHGHALYAAILDYLFDRRVAGASVMRGIAGFGASHHLHTTRILRLTENLPIKIEFIESAEKLGEILPKLQEMSRGGLIEVQDTEILRPSQESSAAPAIPTPAAGRSERLAGAWWRLLESLFTRRRPQP
jgi:PII-like signaling protein